MEETIREVLNSYKGEYADWEVYYPLSPHQSTFHTDNIRWVEEVDMDSKVAFSELMDEEEYDNTICANSEPANFCEWYGDKNVKVLCIAINR